MAEGELTDIQKLEQIRLQLHEVHKTLLHLEVHGDDVSNMVRSLTETIHHVDVVKGKEIAKLHPEQLQGMEP